jgi:hypothetical protein
MNDLIVLLFSASALLQSNKNRKGGFLRGGNHREKALHQGKSQELVKTVTKEQHSLYIYVGSLFAVSVISIYLEHHFFSNIFKKSTYSITVTSYFFITKCINASSRNNHTPLLLLFSVLRHMKKHILMRKTPINVKITF